MGGGGGGGGRGEEGSCPAPRKPGVNSLRPKQGPAALDTLCQLLRLDKPLYFDH